MNAEIRIHNQCKRKFCARQRLAKKKNCKFLTGWKIKIESPVYQWFTQIYILNHILQVRFT